MSNNNIHNSIAKYVVTEDHNVQSLYSYHCKAGKWFIPNDKYLDFLKKIDDELEHNPGKQIHFLEKPNKKYNIIKIDVDLRFKATEEEIKTKINIVRRYTDEFINILVDCIANSIKDIIKVNDSYNIYIQEKDSPRITNEVIKDGIHIIIPDIVMSNEALFYLREQIIAYDKLIKIVTAIGTVNNIEDVIDKRIIASNPWFIYGCGKDVDYGAYYKVSNIFKVISKKAGFTIKKVHAEKKRLDYITLFSNFSKVPNVEYKIDFVDNEIVQDDGFNKDQTFTNNEKEKILRDFAKDASNFRKTTDISREETKAFLNCINPERADSYDMWKRIGIALYNMDHRNIDIWVSWSSQSPKYAEGECFKIWHKEFPKCRKYKIGLNKLKDLAKEDNLDEYNKIININKDNAFDIWIHNHAMETHIKGPPSIATISEFIKTYIKDYANFSIACTNPAVPITWYKFDNHIWSEDKAATTIYMLITDDVYDKLKLIKDELKTKVYNNQKEEQKTHQKHERPSSRDGGGGDDDDESNNSYKQHFIDTRTEQQNIEAKRLQHYDHQHTKLRLEKCEQILSLLSTPSNKEKIIKDLSHKCYDKNFYISLDDNLYVFMCENGV